jgi:hypothetical protein
MTIQSVRMARFRTEVYAARNVYPPSLRSSAARRASSLPRGERSTSVQPVNRFSLFQRLSPCRKRISVTIVPVSRVRYGPLPRINDAYAGKTGPVERPNRPDTQQAPRETSMRRAAAGTEIPVILS